MSEEIAPEVVRQMADLIRELHADHIKYGVVDIEKGFVARTAAIVALLPEPVDPDLLAARKIAVEHAEADDWSANWIEGARVGKHDDCDEIVCALTGIKRGRELERSKP